MLEGALDSERCHLLPWPSGEGAGEPLRSGVPLQPSERQNRCAVSSKQVHRDERGTMWARVYAFAVLFCLARQQINSLTTLGSRCGGTWLPHGYQRQPVSSFSFSNSCDGHHGTPRGILARRPTLGLLSRLTWDTAGISFRHPDRTAGPDRCTHRGKWLDSRCLRP